eukprot:4009566-Alexandrium_andersonii.AAC.1
MRWGRLLDSRHPGPRGDRPPQVNQRRLGVGLEQDALAMAEPADARRCLVDRVVVQAAFAQDRVRQDRPG